MQPPIQRPPILWAHFLVAEWLVSDGKFYSILIILDNKQTLLSIVYKAKTY